MTKYYVSCGYLNQLVTASNQLHACIKAFRKMAQDKQFGELMDKTMRVSERGFAEHDDDYVCYTKDIVHIIYHKANGEGIE